MSKGKRYTDEQLKEIAKWSIGRSVRDTCERFGCHGRIVLEARSKFVDPEIEWPTSGPKKTNIPQADIDMMQQMRNDGMSILDVSAFTGYSRTIVDSRTVTPESKYAPTKQKERKRKLKDKYPEMQLMRNKGITVYEISDHFNCSVSSVVNNTQAAESKEMTLSGLDWRYRCGRPIKNEITVTHNGEIIGTFTPAKNAH